MDTVSELARLAERFEVRLREDMKKCFEIGYDPHKFRGILDAMGGVGTAKHLIACGDRP